MPTLGKLADAGYCIEEWVSWQQGGCGTYAIALCTLRPDLRVGSIDEGAHFFAHDDIYAYDSAGRHRLPYYGLFERIYGEKDIQLDLTVDWLRHTWHYLSEEELDRAIVHIKRCGILQGWYGHE